MDLQNRRSQLKSSPNPARQTDYVIDLTCGSVLIRYIPDKIVLNADCLSDYLSLLQANDSLKPEEFAALILEDFNNELVPRWIHVQIHPPHTGSIQHTVFIEEHQPQWANDALLKRLKLF